MSFQQGLSGLNASAKNLDTIGNNVANSQTVGFKGSTAQFADIYAASLAGGASGNAVGSGVQVANIAQQFTQGNIVSSAGPLDMAINGKGFFRMSDNGAITYSRNGQFEPDKSGFIVDSGGRNLTGYGVALGTDPATGETIANPDMGKPINLRIDPAAQSAPQATGTTTKGVQAAVNLDSRVDVPTTAFSPTDPASYNWATSVTLYDSLGNPVPMTVYFVKVGPPPAPNPNGVAAPQANEWLTYATVPPGQGGTTPVNVDLGTLTPVAAGTQLTAPTTGVAAPATPSGALITFDTNGQLATLNGVALNPTMQVLPVQIPTPPVGPATNTPPGNGASYLQFPLNFEGTTQFADDFANDKLRQDGFGPGKLSSYSINENGALEVRYTNGETSTVGFVRIDKFVNPNGLIPLGNNQWVQTYASGAPVPGTPSTGDFGVLKAMSVEESTVDMTNELVNMITAQRAYQANAQTIKTQDQVLNTLVNLR